MRFIIIVVNIVQRQMLRMLIKLLTSYKVLVYLLGLLMELLPQVFIFLFFS